MTWLMTAATTYNIHLVASACICMRLLCNVCIGWKEGTGSQGTGVAGRLSSGPLQVRLALLTTGFFLSEFIHIKCVYFI